MSPIGKQPHIFDNIMAASPSSPSVVIFPRPNNPDDAVPWTWCGSVQAHPPSPSAQYLFYAFVILNENELHLSVTDSLTSHAGTLSLNAPKNHSPPSQPDVYTGVSAQLAVVHPDAMPNLIKAAFSKPCESPIHVLVHKNATDKTHKVTKWNFFFINFPNLSCAQRGFVLYPNIRKRVKNGRLLHAPKKVLLNVCGMMMH